MKKNKTQPIVGKVLNIKSVNYWWKGLNMGTKLLWSGLTLVVGLPNVLELLNASSQATAVSMIIGGIVMIIGSVVQWLRE